MDRLQPLTDELVQGYRPRRKIMILTYKRSWWFSLLFLLALCPALPAQTEQPTPETSPAEQAPTPIPQESPGPVQPTAQPTVQPVTVPSNPITDAARFLAGLPVADNSSLASLTHTSMWQAHAAAMNSPFATLQRRPLTNLPIYRTTFLGPLASASNVCVYYL